MPTLGIDAKITLSTDKTRQSLDSFYRGLAVESVRVFPYAYTAGDGSVVYNLENNEATFVLFVGDVYDGSDPFDVTVTNLSGEATVFKQCNFLMLNATNLKELRVASALEDKLSFKVYYG